MELKKKLLSALNPNKATGPDNISGRFLKELHEELAPAPTLTFQASITTSGPSAVYHKF
jgi:hypothetical protein